MGRPTVLVVDDEPEWLRAAERSLRGLELQLHLAQGAKEARAWLSADHTQLPRLVISDYFMPEEDGVSLLGWVKNAYPGLPCILYTAGRMEHPGDRWKFPWPSLDVPVLDKGCTSEAFRQLVAELVGVKAAP